MIDLKAILADTSKQLLPFQALPKLPYFVGRDVEKTLLRETLMGETPQVVCTGMAGVGKTSLIADVTYQLRDHFPDGVLWTRLDTSTPFDILGTWGTSFGLEMNYAKTVAARHTLIYDYLADKQVLIILDNAESSDQIKPLLPPTETCAVLITTRQNLIITNNWLRLQIRPFSVTTAMALFRRLLGERLINENRDTFRQMAEQVGHLPLALTLLAGQVRGGKLGETAVAIRQHHTQLDTLTREQRAIRASFNLAHEHLPPTLQHVFAQIGVFGGEDFSLDAVQFVTNTTADEALMALHTLRGFAMLEAGHNGRYRLHPVLRTYALEKLGEDLPHTTCRLASYFVRQWERDNVSPIDYSTVEATLHQLQEQAQVTPLLQLIRLSFQPLVQAGLVVNLEAVLQTLSDTSKNLAHKAELCNWLGHIRYWFGEDAHPYHQQALIWAEKTEELALIGESHQALGTTYWRKKNYQQAETHYQQALNMVNLADSVIQKTELINKLGLVAQQSGQFELAKQQYLESLALCEEIGDPLLQLNTLQHLAGLYAEQGDYEQATAHFTQVETLARDHNDQQALGELLGAWGYKALVAKDFERALTTLQESLFLARDLNQPIHMGHRLADLAELARRKEQWSEAMQLLDEAGRLTAVDPHLQTLCQLRRAVLLRDMGKTAEAQAIADHLTPKHLPLGYQREWQALLVL